MRRFSKGSKMVDPLKLMVAEPLAAADVARARLMRLYAARLKRIEDLGSPKRQELLRTLVFLDSDRGLELCQLLLDGVVSRETSVER
jgi:hypothetical protein